jgi:hypothetical protein
MRGSGFVPSDAFSFRSPAEASPLIERRSVPHEIAVSHVWNC